MCLLSISVLTGFVLIVSGIEQYIDFCSSVARVAGSSLVFDGSDAAINSGGIFPSGISFCICTVQAGSLGLGIVEFSHTTGDLYAPSSMECGKSITVTSSGTSKSTVFGCTSSTDFRRKDVISGSTITLNMSITAPRPRDETYKLEINPGPFTTANSFTATCTSVEVPHTTTSISFSTTSVAIPITTDQTGSASRSVETSPSTTFTPTMPSSTTVSQETSAPFPTSSILYSSTTISPSLGSTSHRTSTFLSTVTTLHSNLSSVSHPSSTTLVSASPSTTKRISTSSEAHHSESEQPSISLSPELDLTSSSRPTSSVKMPLSFETSEIPQQTSTSSTTVSEGNISRRVLIAVSSGCAVALIVIIVSLCSAYFVCKRRKVKREDEMREGENIYQNMQMSRPSDQRSSYSAISQPYDSIGPLYWSFEDVHVEPSPANGVSTFTVGEQLANYKDNVETMNNRRESGVSSEKEYSHIDSVYIDGSALAKDMTHDPGYLVPLSRSVAPIVSRRDSAQAHDYIYPLPDYPS